MTIFIHRCGTVRRSEGKWNASSAVNRDLESELVIGQRNFNNEWKESKQHHSSVGILRRFLFTRGNGWAIFHSKPDDGLQFAEISQGRWAVLLKYHLVSIFRAII